MPKLFLAAKSTADRDNLAPSAERLVNVYALPAPEGARAPLILRSVPAMRDFATLPGPFLRALRRIEGELYAVSAGGLYKVREDGTSAYLAAVVDDPETTLSGHRNNVVVTAGGNYYVYVDGSITEPGDGRIESVGSAAFLDQFTLMSELDGREVEWSTVGAPATRNALYFATAEARDDNIVRLMASGAYLTVLKAGSVELWGNTGQGGASAFIRIQGAALDRGLLGFNLATALPSGIFFIGTDRLAYLGSGMDLRPVSPPNVNQALENSTPTHCFYYEDRGHGFCVIRFGDRPAWVYDMTLGFWHERSTGVEHGPWDVICSEFAYGRWHLGDRVGRVYRLGANPVDATGPLRRTIVTRPFYSEGLVFSVAELELLGFFGKYDVEETAPNWLTDENGFPIRDVDGQYILADEDHPATTTRRPGRLWARVSKDGGHTWGLPKVRGIGMVGHYNARCRFVGMGQFSQFTLEINLTDPVDVPLLSEANLVLA